MGRPKKQQRSLAQMGMFPTLPKPEAAVGQTLAVPGTHWSWGSGERAKEQSAKAHDCLIVKFEALRTFRDSPPSAAFELQDPDPLADGSHTTFWLRYPSPFTEHWYSTRPLPGTDVQPDGALDDHESDPADPTDLPRSVPRNQPRCDEEPNKGMYKYAKYDREEKVKHGKMEGALKSVYLCDVQLERGVCGDELPVINKSTSNGVSHFRRRAKGGCEVHAAALRDIEEDNPRTVLVNGVVVPAHSFQESFPHHVDFVWMISDGVAANNRKKEAFQDYIHGFEPRAVMPHHVTIHRIGECIEELQSEMQDASLSEFKAGFKGEPCLGLQIDLWTDATTHVVFAALTVSRVIELTVG
jgi:hypothetical protein